MFTDANPELHREPASAGPLGMVARPLSSSAADASAPTRPGGAPRLTWGLVEDPMDAAPAELRDAWHRIEELNRNGEFVETRRQLRALRQSENVAGTSEEIARRLRAAEIALDVALGETPPVEELRRLLMAAESRATQLVCAYQLAHALECAHDWKKAAFYAGIVLEAAEALERPSWIAVAHNLIGNIHTGESSFDRAEYHYRQSLARPLGSRLWVAQVFDNLGYVLASRGELVQARRLLAAALGVLRRTDGAARLSAELDAAFVQCLSGQYTPALRHAQYGLRLARELDDRRNVGNALLLIVEASKGDGGSLAARSAARELAEWKGVPEMADVLMGIDLLDTVNLKA